MSEKIKLKGQLKLPVVGKNPTFAQMKFVKVALSEPDILPDSGSIFTCDEQGNYDFEIYTGAHLLSYNVGNAWSKPIEIIAEHLAEGLESIEISDLIGFQEIPELDATIAALNQQKQELLAIQQDVENDKVATAASAAAAEAAAEENKTALDACIQKKDFTFVHDKTANSFELFIPHTSNFAYAFNLMIWSSQEGMNINSAKNFGIYGTTATSTLRVSEIYSGINIDSYVSIGSHRRDANGTYIQVFCQVWTGDFVNSQTFTVSVRDVYSGIPDILEGIEVVNPENREQPAEPIFLRKIIHNDIAHYDVGAEEAGIIGIPIAVFNEALSQQQAQDFFESEKAKAILIMNDHMLGTGEEEITDLQLMDVKAYIQSIDPAKGFKVGIARAKVPRPSIFSRYD